MEEVPREVEGESGQNSGWQTTFADASAKEAWTTPPCHTSSTVFQVHIDTNTDHPADSCVNADKVVPYLGPCSVGFHVCSCKFLITSSFNLRMVYIIFRRHIERGEVSLNEEKWLG